MGKAPTSVGRLPRPVQRKNARPQRKKSRCHAREARTLASGAIYDPQAKIRRIPLYPRKKNPKTGKRRNLGTFATRSAAEKA